jgi:hypothetical protein
VFVPARYTLPQPQQRKLKLANCLRALAQPEENQQWPAKIITASFSPASPDASVSGTSVSDQQNGQVVLLLMTSQQVTGEGAGAPVWHVKTLEVLWVVPESRPAKQIPHKI